MMTDHNAYTRGFRYHKVYCTDTSFGTVGAINEALLYSNNGFIEVLPALPLEWTEGSISGLMARTQAEVSIVWNEKTVLVTVKSLKNQRIIVSYDNQFNSADFNEGEIITFSFSQN